MTTLFIKSSSATRVIAMCVISVFAASAITTPIKAHAQAACPAIGALGVAGGGAAAIAAPTGFPVADKANLVVNTKTAADVSTQTLVQCVLDGLAWTTAKVAVQSLTRSMVNWINSGFQGSPQFVTDLEQNLTYLGDAVAEDFIFQIDRQVMSETGVSIRSPFQDQITQLVRNEYYRTTGSWGLNYTLYQYSNDPAAFIQGDFSQGGFDAYFAMTQNDANNPLFAYQRASDQLWARVDNSRQQRLRELDWGRGFLPWRGPCATAPAGSDVNLARAEGCPFSAVRTPGSIVEDQLAHTLGSGVRQLELADSVNEIVGALMGQLVTQVLGGGGLSGASLPAAGGGQSAVNRATDSSEYNQASGNIAQGVQQNIINDRRGIESYRDNWTRIQGAAQAAQNRCGSSSEASSVLAQASAAIARANDSLSQLDMVAAAVTTAQQTGGIRGVSIAINDYQSFLRSSQVPSAIEIATASAEVGGEGSTYSRMVQLSQNCRVGG